MLLSLGRTLFLYLTLILAVRLMGKRQIGEMEPAEFVVTMLIANLAAIPMQDGGIPLMSGLVPILTVLGVQLMLACLSMRVMPLRWLLCGRPVLLIRQGRILEGNLRRCRLTLDELMRLLRESGTPDPGQVRWAILETDGQLSVVPEGQGTLPVTLVSDGKIREDGLRRTGRDRAWLGRTLREKNCALRDVLLLTLDEAGSLYLGRKGEKT